MARLRDDGTLDEGFDPFQPPKPKYDQYGNLITDGTDTGQNLPGGGTFEEKIAPPPTAPSAPPPPAPTPTDAASSVAQWQQQFNPYNHPLEENAYWERRIGETGGPTPDNLAYFKSRYMEDPNNNANLTESQKQGPKPTFFQGLPQAKPISNVNGPGPNAGSNNTGPSNNVNDELSNFLVQLLTQQQTRDSQTRAQRQGLMDKINGLITQYSTPVSADDPIIKGRTTAYQGNVDRGVGNYREMAAERAHAEGVPTGAFDAQIGNAVQTGGRAVGDFESQLMSDEMTSRRAALSDTLKQGAGLLSEQDQADIQQQIAAIDGAMRSRGLDVTASLGNRGLDIQQLLGTGNLELGSRGLDLQKLLGMSSLDLQKLLGIRGQDITSSLGQGGLANQRLGLTNQNQQYYDRFGYDQGHDSAMLDYLYRALGLS